MSYTSLISFSNYFKEPYNTICSTVSTLHVICHLKKSYSNVNNVSKIHLITSASLLHYKD